MLNRKMLKPSNLLFAIVLLFVVSTRLPQILEHIKLEGQPLIQEERRNILENQTIIFPPSAGHAMVIYWATWCAPCKLEMNRLKSSVESGAIPKERIFAVSLFEEESEVQSFLQKNPYPFIFLALSKNDESLNIRATPTTLIVQDGKIRSISQGMSLWGIWWAEFLFKNHLEMQQTK